MQQQQFKLPHAYDQITPGYLQGSLDFTSKCTALPYYQILFCFLPDWLSVHHEMFVCHFKDIPPKGKTLLLKMVVFIM